MNRIQFFLLLCFISSNVLSQDILEGHQHRNTTISTAGIAGGLVLEAYTAMEMIGSPQHISYEDIKQYEQHLTELEGKKLTSSQVKSVLNKIDHNAYTLEARTITSSGSNQILRYYTKAEAAALIGHVEKGGTFYYARLIPKTEYFKKYLHNLKLKFFGGFTLLSIGAGLAEFKGALVSKSYNQVNRLAGKLLDSEDNKKDHSQIESQ